MTARIVQFLAPGTSSLEVARQDYKLAKRHFEAVSRNGCAWEPEHQKRFHAAIQRQQEARERYLRAMGA